MPKKFYENRFAINKLKNSVTNSDVSIILYSGLRFYLYFHSFPLMKLVNWLASLQKVSKFMPKKFY
jgi:hypothetical protein